MNRPQVRFELAGKRLVRILSGRIHGPRFFYRCTDIVVLMDRCPLARPRDRCPPEVLWNMATLPALGAPKETLLKVFAEAFPDDAGSVEWRL